MSLFLAAAMLGSQTVPPPPIGLLFNFFRMNVFRERAKELGCAAGDLDRELEEIRPQLVGRYGSKSFSPPEHPPSGMPGDCGVVLAVYRMNLAGFRREAAAVLSAPAPSSSPPSQ